MVSRQNVRVVFPYLAAALVACSTSPGVDSTADSGTTAPDSGGADSSGGGADAGSVDSGGVDANAPPSDAGTSDAGNMRLHVEGNQLVRNGKPFRMIGVNHSGTEYACAQGYGIFDGASDDTLATAIASWHANTVRVPLNEDCWLALNGVKPAYSGATYQKAITDHVAMLLRHGLVVIVELHWNAPGTYLADGQQPMADADHALDFWKSVAPMFKDSSDVVFDLYNEPYINTSNAQTSDAWACWRDGCTITQARNIPGGWRSAGMQQMLDAVRGTGATNVVMMGGLEYSNDLSGWLSHMPIDPLKQIAASLHLYNFNACKDTTCWNAQNAPVALKVPLVTGEIGEDTCGHSFVDGYMQWADARGISYLGWTFNAWDCKTGPALITDQAGTPTGFGAGIKAHFLLVNP